MAELILDSVSQSYGNRQIIADLSFTLPEGAIGCLLGPSGCGKTTALRCISGFEPIQTRRNPHRRRSRQPPRLDAGRPKNAASAWCSRTTRCFRI